LRKKHICERGGFKKTRLGGKKGKKEKGGRRPDKRRPPRISAGHDLADWRREGKEFHKGIERTLRQGGGVKGNKALHSTSNTQARGGKKKKAQETE